MQRLEILRCKAKVEGVNFTQKFEQNNTTQNHQTLHFNFYHQQLLYHQSDLKMFCSLSGVVPQEPVVSSKSGHLFEKRLILQKLEQGNICPITGASLLPSELVAVQVAAAGGAPPRMASSANNATTSGASLPSMLDAFRGEWDAVVLESHTLRSQLLDTRQQLSVALYEKDAARRVIANLLKEREDLKRMVVDGASNGDVVHMDIDTSTSPSNSNSNSSSSSSSSSSSTPGPVTSESIITANGAISAARGTRKKPTNWTTNDAMKTFTETASRSPHKSSAKGILSIAIHPNTAESLVLSGGVDRQCKMLSSNTYKVQGTMSGHKGGVTCVGFTPAFGTGHSPITASEDGTIKIWDSSVKKTMKCQSTLTGHQSGISSLSLHPTLPLCLTTSKSDGTWRTWDYGVGSDLMRCSGGAPGTTGIQHASLHPDGLVIMGGVNQLGGGQSNAVVMWDIRESATQKCKPLGQSAGSMTSLTFSVNGYNAASGDDTGVVQIWDLRKAGNGAASVTSFNIDGCCHQVKYDAAGKYLAACSNSTVEIYAHKKWAGPLVSLKGHGASIKCMDFMDKSSSLVTGSMDRTMKFWSAP